VVAVNAGLKVVAKRQTMSVAPATTFIQLVTLAIRDKEVSKSYDRVPLTVHLYPSAQYNQQDQSTARIGDAVGPSVNLGYKYIDLILRPVAAPAPAV
jgi:hypothetical protein